MGYKLVLTNSGASIAVEIGLAVTQFVSPDVYSMLIEG